MQYRKHKNRGFALVEMMVSVTILGIVLGSGFYVIQSSIANATHARHQVTAFYLAQEAFEYVKTVRNMNSEDSGTAWLEGLEQCFDGGSCNVDVVAQSMPSTVSCDRNSGCKMYRNEESNKGRGLYSARNSHSGSNEWVETIFTREIEIQCWDGYSNVIDCNVDDSANDAVITVTMSWEDQGREGGFEVVQHLFNIEI